MAKARKYGPVVKLKAYKMREIDKVPIPDIMRITEIKSESGTYAIINRVKSDLQASRTLRAYMNVSISTEADIAVALDMPEEVVKHHLREPVIPHEKLYHLIFPEEPLYDYNSIQSLWELEQKLEEKVIQPITEPVEDGTPGEDPHIPDVKSYASKEVSEALQELDELKKSAMHLGLTDAGFEGIMKAFNHNTEMGVKLEECLKTIAERIGVPAELDKVLEQIDENINTALSHEQSLNSIAERLSVSVDLDEILNEIDALETSITAHSEKLKAIASHLGVPDTVEHIKQRIDEYDEDNRKLRANEKEAFNRGFDHGFSAGKEMIILEHEKNEILAKQADLKDQQDFLKKQQDNIEQRFQKLGERIRNKRKE